MTKIAMPRCGVSHRRQGVVQLPLLDSMRAALADGKEREG